MKSITTKLMIAAAAVAIASGVATAQPFKAEIPFAFQAGGKVMAPGTYLVNVQYADHKLVVLSNYEAKQNVLLLSGPGRDPSKAMASKGDPVLSFECGIGRCALTRLWTGSVEPVLTFPHRTSGSDAQASLTEIRLVKVNGD